MSAQKKKTKGSIIVPKRPYSKFQIVLFTLFVLAIGFFIGMQYQFAIVSNLPFNFPPNHMTRHAFLNHNLDGYRQYNTPDINK